MKFENIIRSLSSTIALVVVYLIVAGMYLSVKGFVFNGEQIVLARSAYAQDVASPKQIPADLALPEIHSVGKADAPVTIYEYSSFGCSHCADFHLQVLPKIVEKYVSKGLVRVVFVPFPLEKLSMDAALLAECVDDEKYFPFVEVLFKKQRDWGFAQNPQKVLKQYAALSGVDIDKGEACLHDDEAARLILENRQTGISQLGIQGTPSFIVAANGKRELVSGGVTLDLIDVLLSVDEENNNVAEVKETGVVLDEGSVVENTEDDVQKSSEMPKN